MRPTTVAQLRTWLESRAGIVIDSVRTFEDYNGKRYMHRELDVRGSLGTTEETLVSRIVDELEPELSSTVLMWREHPVFETREDYVRVYTRLSLDGDAK